MPRALALTWELLKSDLPASTKKATLRHFDSVVGQQLADWQTIEETIPAAITTLARQREQARGQKRRDDADALRKQIAEAGCDIVRIRRTVQK